MTKKEAIKHGKEQLEIFWGKNREFIKVALKSLENTRWIPVEERLPKKDEKVILLYSNRKISGGKYKGSRTFEIDFKELNKKIKVIAWMPSPEA